VALLFPKVINWDLVLRGAILAPFQDLVWYLVLRPQGEGRGGEWRGGTRVFVAMVARN